MYLSKYKYRDTILCHKNLIDWRNFLTYYLSIQWLKNGLLIMTQKLLMH